MIKLGRYLRKYWYLILLSIGLIYTQARFDLALPDYMAKIVDVGISKSGVENSVPTVIRESELTKIKYLIPSSEERTLIEEHYSLLDKNTLAKKDYESYVKKYPLLESNNLYKLNTDDKEIIEQLDKILSKAILVVVQMDANTNPMSQIVAEIPESAISAVTAAYIAKEYEEIGMKLSTLQAQYVFKIGGIMIALSLLSLLVTVIASYIFTRIAAGVSYTMRSDIFSKVESFSNTEFDKFSTASLITRTTNDVQQVQMLIVMLRLIIYAPILGIGGIIRVSNTNSSMVWIIVLAVVTMLVLIATIFTIAIPNFKKIQKLVDKVNLVTRESLIGMMVIRAFNTQKHEEKRFDNVNKELTKTLLFVSRWMSLMMPIMMVVMNGTSILIIWFGSKQVDLGNLEIGNMIAFIQYAMQIIMSFLMLSIVFIMMPRASVSISRIFEILDAKLSIRDPEQAQSFQGTKKGFVEFHNVSFAYPDAEEPVLKNINFTAKPGQTTAFIGSTGSGKSTLINLIPRFYDVTEGQILVDGQDIRSVTQHDLRDKIGYVPQKGQLFSGTIASNLRYSDDQASDQDIEKAASIAQAISFIQEKPDGFDSEIVEGGSNVSGGQKQRLSIARALVKRPEIYIFDDSFSALDFKTDSELRKALKDQTGDSTVLIVAQRISTILNADQIIVLNEGQIAGIGSHKELINTCDVYQEIAYSQLSKEELA